MTSLQRFSRAIPPVSKTAIRTCHSASNKRGVPYETTKQTESLSTPTEVPAEADVVVIGGGSLGCNTLYHLAKLGITNTVLLESHKLTAGKL